MESLTYLKSILIGIFQGFTEFLPVSSSGHVMLLSEIFGVELEGAALGSFTVMLHVGTLISVLVVYFRRVWDMLRHPIKGDLKWLVVATLPTVLYALLLKATGWDAVIDNTARTLLPFAFCFTAVLMFLADGIATNRRIAKMTHKHVKFRDALSAGLMQCVGTFTGVSRAGSTIVGGFASGLDRRSAADFSFLMSMPAIFGAMVLDGWELYESGAMAEAFGSHVSVLCAGVLAAFVAGLVAIKLMVAAVKNVKLKWFGVYLLLLSAAILVNDYVTAIW